MKYPLQHSLIMVCRLTTVNLCTSATLCITSLSMGMWTHAVLSHPGTLLYIMCLTGKVMNYSYLRKPKLQLIFHMYILMWHRLQFGWLLFIDNLDKNRYLVYEQLNLGTLSSPKELKYRAFLLFFFFAGWYRYISLRGALTKALTVNGGWVAVGRSGSSTCVHWHTSGWEAATLGQWHGAGGILGVGL